MTDPIDPADATVTEAFDPHLGQLIRVEVEDETYSVKRFGGRVLAIVDFHPDWVIEALERDGRFDVTKATEEDMMKAQREQFGLDDEDEDEDD